jgi:hypothetical protein
MDKILNCEILKMPQFCSLLLSNTYICAPSVFNHKNYSFKHYKQLNLNKREIVFL